MITEKTKANAIALLQLGDTPAQVASELELPLMLVNEWQESLAPGSLLRLSANTNALSRLASSDASNTQENVELLRTKIEETAIEIVDEVKKRIVFGDLVQAKTLQLLADTCTKLYSTVVNKNSPMQGNTPGQQALTMFEQMSRD